MGDFIIILKFIYIIFETLIMEVIFFIFICAYVKLSR